MDATPRRDRVSDLECGQVRVGRRHVEDPERQSAVQCANQGATLGQDCRREWAVEEPHVELPGVTGSVRRDVIRREAEPGERLHQLRDPLAVTAHQTSFVTTEVLHLVFAGSGPAHQLQEKADEFPMTRFGEPVDGDEPIATAGPTRPA